MIARLALITALTLTWICLPAQEILKYQKPPAEIMKIVDAPLTPGVFIDPGNKKIILAERSGILTISDLSAEELKIAGLRINPATNGPSRLTYNKG